MTRIASSLTAVTALASLLYTARATVLDFRHPDQASVNTQNTHAAPPGLLAGLSAAAAAAAGSISLSKSTGPGFHGDGLPGPEQCASASGCADVILCAPVSLYV